MYPSSVFDNPTNILQLLGSYWQSTYQGGELIYDICRARSETEKQLELDTAETIDCLSVFTTPTFKTARNHPVKFYQANQSPASAWTIGGGYSIGSTPTIGFPSSRAVRYTVDTEIAELPVLVDNVSRPTKIYVNNVDYLFDRTTSTVTFLEEPFLETALEENATGTFGLLWGQPAKLDKRYLDVHAGYVVSTALPSSANYRLFLTALFEAICGGSSAANIRRLIAAVTDVPTTSGELETVVDIVTGDRLQIITDKAVYTYRATSTATVAIGETLSPYSWPVDTIQIFECNRKSTPAALTSLTLGKEFFSGVTTGSLTFSNADVAISVSTVSSYTKITFVLGGDAADVTAFFDTMHTKGIARGRTLANCLDIRANPTDEPTAASLPATINPMQLLFENVLRGNAVVVKVKPAAYGENALNSYYLQFLRKIVPPQSTVIITE